MVLRQCSASLSQATVYFNQGQMGSLAVDGSMIDQPRFTTPSGYSVTLVDVYVTLGKAGDSTTTLQSSVLSDPGTGLPPTPGSPTSTLNIPSGAVVYPWTAMEGVTLTSGQHLQTRIQVAGSGSDSLVIHYWGHTDR